MKLFVNALFFIFFFPTTVISQGMEEANKYHKNSSLQWEWALSSIENTFWRGDERVLDIGCGDGKITAYLSKRVPDGVILGMDLSKKMIRFASDSLNVKECPNLLFLEGGADSLPFYTQFDSIVSFCCLHWVKDQNKALKSIYEALIPGGRVLLVIPAKHPNNLSHQVEKLIQQEKWASYFPSYENSRVYFTPDEYEKLMERAGFHSVRTVLTEQTNIYENREALKEWILPLVTFTSHLTADLQKQFIEDLTDSYLSRAERDDAGHILMVSLKLDVQAIK